MKYYEIMEYVNNAVGAKFYYVDETEKDNVINSLENNFDIKEISEKEYKEEQKRMYRKNYYLATGYRLSDQELENAYN